MKLRLPLYVLLPLLCFLAPCNGYSTERILSYHSDIAVAADATMSVTETIRVRAEGNRIRRGIYRDFPTDYVDAFGNRFVVDFTVLGATRDGVPEKWRTEARANGVRVYIGDPQIVLKPRDYSYGISYLTNRQIGYFKDYDELYWNVTGNGWGFSIDRVSATVELPGRLRAADISMGGYTGNFGEKGQHYAISIEDGRAHIHTTRSLRAGQGLTLVTGWPKGVVREPGALERFGYVLKDNRGLLLALATLLLVAGYLYYVWVRFGRDPEAGVIFPQYEAPEGYSPGSVRYISRLGYDDKAMSAAVINLAVKGHLSIVKTHGEFTLLKESSKQPLAAGESALLQELFKDSSSLVLRNENHRIIATAKKAHLKALKRDYLNNYFFKNTGLLIPSVFFSLLILGLLVLLEELSFMVVAVFVLVFALHGLYAWLLKAPTPKGRRLMDKLEGFRMYMEVAEKDDLNRGQAPDLTGELFEKYLPYAVALGVEQAWGERFTRELVTRDQGQQVSYKPAWYQGYFHHDDLGNFTTEVGSSFSSAISSAGSPPGSSSGGGGGGSSGGGGGGGGGGGW